MRQGFANPAFVADTLGSILISCCYMVDAMIGVTFLIRAVALILDFISAVTQVTRSKVWQVALLSLDLLTRLSCPELPSGEM